MITSKRGFTVIELLVVVAIIAILIGIISAAIISETNKAKTARANADISQFVKAVIVARANTNQYLRDLTGSDWSAGLCIDRDITNIPDTDPCYVQWLHILTVVSEASGFPGIMGMKRDPWGSPYLLNENEWAGQCQRDIIYSNGPQWNNNAENIPDWDGIEIPYTGFQSCPD